MTEAGFFAPRKVNRTGLVVVIAIHAAAISALALSKMEMPPRFVPVITDSWNVPLNPVPPEVEPKPTEIVPSLPHSTPRIVKLRIPDRETEVTTESAQTQVTADPQSFSQGEQTAVRPADPPREAVRLAAAPDPRAIFQPPYPPSAIRLGDEGAVKVRVLIGTDGRVKAVEKISATNDAFWRATERHALRNWRFSPATLDGRPVESWREMTVRFELSANV